MTPAQQPQREYIIDEEYIQKLDEWLDEHGIDELQRMQIRTRLKFVPNIATGWSIHQDDFDRLAKLVVNCDTPEATKLRAWGNNIRTRPHTPAPDTISKELALELCMDGRKEAARTATLATLDAIDEEIMKKEEWTRLELLAIIAQQKSLRSTTTAAQEER